MVIDFLVVYTMPAQVPSWRLTCVTSTPLGSVSGSTAKLWFCAEISMRPEGLCLMGWLPPWWPNFSLKVLPAGGKRDGG
jgi:hypothetical protein